jgi:hypothetical protein
MSTLSLLEIGDAEYPVPNGTGVLTETDRESSAVLDLVQRYKTFQRKTAESYIRMAATLAEAHRQLSDMRLHDFCSAVGLEKGGSTYKKMLKIGQKLSRFEPFLDRLPDAWTTIHKLASLENHEFDRVATDERFGPTMTAVDLHEILGGKKSSSHAGELGEEERLPNDCRIHLNGFDKGQKMEVCEKVLSLAKEYGFKCSFSSSLEKELLPKPKKPSLREYLYDKVAA